MTISILSKICTKCGAEKQACEFAKMKAKRDGLRLACKPCEYQVNAAYRAANREKVREAGATYRKANPEKIKAASATYRAKSLEGMRLSPEKIKAYRAANADKKKISDAAWRAANPNAKRVYDHNRRARMRDNGGSLSRGIALWLYKSQRGRCPCCAQLLGGKYHLDHIIPIYLGGANIDSNMQLLRQRCNNQKHAKHPIDFMQERGFLL